VRNAAFAVSLRFDRDGELRRAKPRSVDHGYFFIQSVVDDHLRFHAERLL
jgi:S-formylglutathione hydrolase FrmB